MKIAVINFREGSCDVVDGYQCALDLVGSTDSVYKLKYFLREEGRMIVRDYMITDKVTIHKSSRGGKRTNSPVGNTH
jgi:hypothetical protein